MVAMVLCTTAYPARANAQNCAEEFLLQNPAGLEAFLALDKNPTGAKISINGRDVREAFTADYVLRMAGTSYVCLKNMTFVVGKVERSKLVKLIVTRRTGSVRIFNTAFYGHKTLLDLVGVRGEIRIVDAEFAKSKKCFRVPRDGTVTLIRSTMYNCGVARGGRTYQHKRIRIKFKENQIFLMSAKALKSFLALPSRSGPRRLPLVVYSSNTFYVRNGNVADRLARMLDKKNVRCARNRIVVLKEVNKEKKNRCVEIVSANEEDFEHVERTRRELRPVDRTEWLLAEVAAGGLGQDGGGSAGEGSAGDGPSESLADGLPFRDGTFFTDGTGWIVGAAVSTACNGC